ncbi:MAG: hypothetical protein IPJ65_22960 [Archangiaceae bacterium]|nr:hypothetical protein [Archangiaceae bacterium]
MNDPLPSLPKDIAEALALEAKRSPPPQAALAQVQARIAASVAASASLAPAFATSVAKVTAAVVAALAVGGAGGFWVRTVSAPAVAPHIIVLPVTLPAPVAPPVEAVPAPVAPAAPREPRVVAAPSPQLERLLIERATVALARGDLAGALDACREHEQKFAQGMLVEERESLAIRALAAEGQMSRARARADRFHARFPNSMQAQVIDDALKK